MGFEVVPFTVKIALIICLTSVTFVLIYKRASPLQDPTQETALRRKQPETKDRPLYTNYSMVSLLLDTEGLNLFEEAGSDDEFASKVRDADPYVPYCTFTACGCWYNSYAHISRL
jgi:hypothetical protein